MKKLDIVFTKSRKKFRMGSWLIRTWTGKPYSHVARSIEIRDWGKRYFQASEGSVNYEHEKFFLAKHVIMRSYTLSVSESLDREVKKACYEEAGNIYGMAQNIGTALVDIGLCKDTPWKNGRNCSEIIYLKVLKVMIPELDYNADTVKPHNIEEIIQEYFTLRDDGVWELK